MSTKTFIIPVGGGGQGIQGIQGITGLQGIAGADGIQGIQGITGLQGIAGEGGGSSAWYGSMPEFQAITPKENHNYFIEGNTIEMVVTFTDKTTATYNVVVDD